MKSLSIDKKISLIMFTIFVTALAVFVYTQSIYGTKVAQAFGLRYLPDQTIATTTPYQTFMKSGAGNTATTTVNSDGSEQLSLLVMLGSSTTPPTLQWRVQYSSDGIDWYDEDVALGVNSTTTAHVIGGALNTWVFSTTTANQVVVTGTNNVKYTTKKIVIPNLDTTYTRIVWSATGGDYLLNVRPSLKNTLVLPK